MNAVISHLDLACVVESGSVAFGFVEVRDVCIYHGNKLLRWKLMFTQCSTTAV